MNKKYPIKKRVEAYVTKTGKYIHSHEKIIYVSAMTAAAIIIAALAIKDANYRQKLRTDSELLDSQWKRMATNPTTRSRADIRIKRSIPLMYRENR